MEPFITSNKHEAVYLYVRSRADFMRATPQYEHKLGYRRVWFWFRNKDQQERLLTEYEQGSDPALYQISAVLAAWEFVRHLLKNTK